LKIGNLVYHFFFLGHFEILFVRFMNFKKKIGLEQNKKIVKSRNLDCERFCKFLIFHKLFSVCHSTLETNLLKTLHRLDFFEWMRY
jgi:hypothetical protein